MSCFRKCAMTFGIVALSGLMIPDQAVASGIQVYVGYADSLRAAPDFPTPFALGETFNNGTSTFTVDLFGAHSTASAFDSGAIMILNDTGAPLSLTSLSVNDRANGVTYAIWGAVLGGALPAGGAAIFAETLTSNNFDSSDFGGNTHAYSYAGFDPDTNNCSTGPIASQASCVNFSPIVTFDGTDYIDSGHVLDTGGFDSAGYNHNHSNGTVSTNESLQWRLIGTSGINNPGGTTTTPEPTSMILLGSGLIGLTRKLRKRRTK